MNQRHKHFNQLGRRALATLAAITLLLGSTAFAQGGKGTGKITGSGMVSDTQVGRTLLGWNVGTVTVTRAFLCLDCSCTFVGPAVLSETLLSQSCRIISVQTSPITCSTSVSPLCPGGTTGESTIINYECCVSLAGTILCTHKTIGLLACP